MYTTCSQAYMESTSTVITVCKAGIYTIDYTSRYKTLSLINIYISGNESSHYNRTFVQDGPAILQNTLNMFLNKISNKNYVLE